MRGIVQNGTKECSVRLATHLLKQSEFRGQIIESYQSPNDSLNFITRARIDGPPTKQEKRRAYTQPMSEWSHPKVVDHSDP